MRDILNRVSSGRSDSSTSLSATQTQVDQLVGGFVAQATDVKMLASMVGGATAYRLGRLGLSALGSGNLVRALSIGGGLAAEVSTFEVTHRSLTTLSGRGGPMWPPAPESTIGGRPHGGAPTSHGESNLWRWSGSGGLRQGLLQSFITFATLKGAGGLAQDQNIIVQHLFQDTALVLGHQTAGKFGVSPAPTGTLAEQFLHAEATNLQIGAGMALAHRIAPEMHALERGLDLSMGATDVGARSPRPGEETSPLHMQPAFALASTGRKGVSPDYQEKAPDKPFILMSEKLGDGEDSTPPSSGDRTSSEPPIGGSVIEENAFAWAVQNWRPQEDAALVARLAWNIREEMWQVLNLRIDSEEAKALAHGDLLSVQIHPLDGFLENYRVVLSSNLEAPRESTDFVQWTLDSKTGALASVVDSAEPPPPAAHRHGFIPFYRWIDFISDGLKSDSLFEGLSPQIQEFLLTDRTQIYRGKSESTPTQQQVAGPTTVVAFFPQIAEGIRESVDRYCDLHHLPEKGRIRLQRLAQFILAAIHEKELAYPKYSQYPLFHIWVIPHPEQPGKKRVEVLTAGEAWQWHQDRGGKVRKEDILLVLDRTYWGPEQTRPFLVHQYTHTDAQGDPVGADLEFQRSLGLGEKRMKVYMLDLVPSPEKIAEWNAK